MNNYIAEAYEKFKHLDKLLTDPALVGDESDFRGFVAGKLWAAVKATLGDPQQPQLRCTASATFRRQSECDQWTPSKIVCGDCHHLKDPANTSDTTLPPYRNPSRSITPDCFENERAKGNDTDPDICKICLPDAHMRDGCWCYEMHDARVVKATQDEIRKQIKPIMQCTYLKCKGGCGHPNRTVTSPAHFRRVDCEALRKEKDCPAGFGLDAVDELREIVCRLYDDGFKNPLVTFDAAESELRRKPGKQS